MATRTDTLYRLNTDEANKVTTSEPNSDYSKSDDASKKIEDLFSANQNAKTTAAAQTKALNTATEQAYLERQLQGQQAQNQFAQNNAAGQLSALDAIRKSNASSIANGANAGLSAANQLAAILGLQENTVAESTQLANDSITAATERNTSMAQNAVTGQTQANQINQANLDRDLGLASLFPQLNAAEAEASKADATVKAAELGLDASKYTADTQAWISKMQLDRDWDKTLVSAATEMYDRLQKEKSGYTGDALTLAARQQNQLEAYFLTGDKRLLEGILPGV